MVDSGNIRLKNGWFGAINQYDMRGLIFSALMMYPQFHIPLVINEIYSKTLMGYILKFTTLWNFNKNPITI